VAGSYQFSTGSDDGSMIWLDGSDTAAVNNNYFQGVTWRSGPVVNLTQGMHDITIGFYQGVGDYVMYANVVLPGQADQRLPNSLLLNPNGPAGTVRIGTLDGAGTVALGANKLEINSGSDTTFTGKITGTGGSVTKMGAGVLTLTGASNFTGAMTFAGGTVATNKLTGSTNPLGTGSLIFDGGALRYTAGNLATSRRATMNAGGGTIDVSTAATTLTLTGVLNGPGSFTKAGLGTLELDGANTYEGGTVVSAGKLVIGNVNALLPGHSLTIGAGGTVVLRSGLSMAGAAGGAAAASPVPEPGSLALLAAGLLLGLSAWLHRRGRVAG
jgi:autotransporter-associated beta strand protein